MIDVATGRNIRAPNIKNTVDLKARLLLSSLNKSSSDGSAGKGEVTAVVRYTAY